MFSWWLGIFWIAKNINQSAYKWTSKADLSISWAHMIHCRKYRSLALFTASVVTDHINFKTQVINLLMNICNASRVTLMQFLNCNFPSDLLLIYSETYFFSKKRKVMVISRPKDNKYYSNNAGRRIIILELSHFCNIFPQRQRWVTNTVKPV